MSIPLQTLTSLLTTTPAILKTLILHLLGLSPTSRKWDLHTLITVTTLRAILSQSHKSSISAQQQRTIEDRPVRGEMWISRVTFPVVPSESLRNVMLDAVQALGNRRQEYSIPDMEPVEAEWTGYRLVEIATTPELEIDEGDKYRCLMNEVTSPVVLLYFHGGSYYLMDPASHRGVVAEYARLTGGRALSVRYRLAPQHPFPSQLLDALLVYLLLLYPHDGSLHDAVKPEHIVLGGDSSGGNLALALLQTILYLQRSAQESGIPVPIPSPAGLALISPTLDLTRSLRSPTPFDYLPLSSPTHNPVASSPPCNLWPSTPARAEIFCTASMLSHPLVSPLAVSPEHWKGAPPIFISCGEEAISLECKVFASILAKQGVKVVWEQYEAMPHCFSHLFLKREVGRMGVEGVAEFVKRVVTVPQATRTSGSFVEAKTLGRSEVDVSGLGGGVEDGVVERMERAKDQIVIMWEEKMANDNST
ncbi:alpha/beta hydrolase fold-domain-containing protein [Aspergillus pseudodeflectus]|uniref:Alpha/beta hydrolase fold-domain-containing protein n=1 Tax=Aspergillus pseudodeflectus TaxID=176178 RepID=A0ABR4KCH2_9EURO